MRKAAYILLLTMAPMMLCAQQYYFTLEERHPAVRPLLQGKQRVLVVNNTTPQPDEFGHNNAVDGVVLQGDSVALGAAALRCLFQATQVMDESGEYERVELMEISQNRSRNFYTRRPMTQAAMEQLCCDYQVDALVILNQLVLYDMQESFPIDEGQYYAYLQAYAQSHWTVHIAGQVQDDTFVSADTLLWESDIYYTRARAMSELPIRQQALLYLAQQVGESVGQSLTPQWQPYTHYLYANGNDSVQAGIEAFQHKHWSRAISVWGTVVETGDKKTRAIAAANMAIAAEMTGDYASACDYARRAVRLFGDWKNADGRRQQTNMRYYLAHLQARQAEEEVLSAY